MSNVPRDILQLSALLGEPGWEAYSKRCESVIKVWETQLLNPAAKRKSELPDDYLRGRIDALRLAISWPGSLVEQHMQQAEETRDDDRRARALDARAHLGFGYPGVIEGE